LGFAGAATTTSKCNCPAPYNVYWTTSPYCIAYGDAVTFKQQSARETLLIGKIRQLYDSIIWPAAAGWAGDIATGNYNGAYFELFSHDVKGVIDPLGTVTGFQGTAEYFVGQVWTGISRISATPFIQIYASGDAVFVNVDILFGQYLTPESTTPYYSYNLTQTGVFNFNSDDQIYHVDLVIHNVQLAVGPANPDNLQYRTVTCQTIFGANCGPSNDPAGYYTDMNDCVNFMNSIEFGSWDNIRQNTTTCRVYHATLALLRPSEHCPHTGKTGGGKCSPHTAADYYADPNIRGPL